MMPRYAMTLVLLPLIPAVRAAQAPPPAEYLNLQIRYELAAGPTLTETRTGRIRLNAGPALAAVQGVLLPLLNRAGSAELKEFSVTRADGATAAVTPGEPQRSPGSVFWAVAAAGPGDVIRFATRQTVDLEVRTGGWWFNQAIPIPLPVQKGGLELQLPPGLAGSVRILAAADYVKTPSGHAWSIAGQMEGTRRAYFAVSSFADQAAFGRWLAKACPAEPSPEIRRLAASVPASADILARARRLTDLFSRQIRVSASATIQPDACRSAATVLREHSAEPLEAQALLAALLRAAGIPAERGLVTADAADAAGAAPGAFTGAWVRARATTGHLWFNAVRTAGSSGIPSEAPKPVLLIEDGRWTELVADLPPSAGGRLHAVLKASVLANGTLQGGAELIAEGPPSDPLRAAMRREGDGREIWAPFFSKRRAAAAPMTTDPYDLRRPFRLSVALREPGFADPSKRLLTLPINLVPLATDPVPLSGRRWWIGPVGTFREEISLEAPAHSVAADRHVNEHRKFARYQSDAVAEHGVLRIVRQLEILDPIVTEAEKAQMDLLWAMVRADQSSAFGLRRTSRAGLDAWIASVPTYEAGQKGWEAFQSRDFETARLLLERTTKADPRDPYAWNNLGLTLLELGRLREARSAFEKQIEVNPKDEYSYNNLGTVDLREGRWAQALERFRKQLELNPNDRFTLGNLPQALVALGRWPEAESAWSQAARAVPGNALYRAQEVAARICQGKEENPKEALNRVMSLGAPGPLPLNNIAYELARCGKALDLAEEMASRAVTIAEQIHRRSPDLIAPAFASQAALASFLDTLGWILFRQGDSARAIPLLESAVALQPNGEGLDHLGQVFWKVGRTAEAAQFWRDALAVMPGLETDVPQDARSAVAQAAPRDLDDWIRVPGAAGPQPPGEPLHFVVFTNPNGSIRRVAPLEPERGEPLAALVRKLKLPVVTTEQGPLGTVQVVRLARGAGGAVEVFRSTSRPAIAMAMDVAEAEVPTASDIEQDQEEQD